MGPKTAETLAAKTDGARQKIEHDQASGSQSGHVSACAAQFPAVLLRRELHRVGRKMHEASSDQRVCGAERQIEAVDLRGRRAASAGPGAGSVTSRPLS